MELFEKLDLLSEAVQGNKKIEYKYLPSAPWELLKLEDDASSFVDASGITMTIERLLGKEIREARNIPLLSDEDAKFAEKYLPHDWWIARQKQGHLMIFKKKPIRGEDSYTATHTAIHGINVSTFPKFESIKWENDDCFTVSELLEKYNERR